MKIVILVDRSAGNDSVGSMWTETYLFDDSTTLKNVLSEIGELHSTSIKDTVKIQIAQE